MDEFPLTRMCGLGIIIRRSRRIKKFRRIRIQPLCSEHLYWGFYLFLGRNEGFYH
jgi:hypothetical protein